MGAGEVVVLCRFLDCLMSLIKWLFGLWRAWCERKEEEMELVWRFIIRIYSDSILTHFHNILWLAQHNPNPIDLKDTSTSVSKEFYTAAWASPLAGSLWVKYLRVFGTLWTVAKLCSLDALVCPNLMVQFYRKYMSKEEAVPLLFSWRWLV